MKAVRFAAALLALTVAWAAAGQTEASTARKSTATLVKTGVAATVGTIIVTKQGFTLYHWTHEKPGQITCTGSCARSWPPLLVPRGTSILAKVSRIPGRFSIIVRPNGNRQLAYEKHALYLYTGDTKPGQALCQAIEGWYVFQLRKR